MRRTEGQTAVPPSDAGQRLQAAAQAMGWVLREAARDQLLAYLVALLKWNRVYNLTSLRDPEDALTHHLIDSLSAVAPLLRRLEQVVLEGGAQVLDVGSGGGLPGVVLAICLPQVQVTCVDTVAKKAAFIQQVAASLRLGNLRGVHARVESLPGPFDVVTSRAFASLVDFTQWSRKALAADGVWMAMKGKHPAPELADLAAGAPDVEVFHVEPLAVPGLDAERCLVWMRLPHR
jgi:16S rRNA (guanine527-N7)-methyltransferase